MDKTEFITWARKLAMTYEPRTEVRDKLSHVRLIAFVGPTGVGKTTIIQSTELAYVKSDVTRHPRDGEKNGREYNFRDDYMQILDDIKNGRYVQFVINSNNEFYGTLADEYPEGGNCTMAIIAKAVPHFRNLGFADVLPIYVLPPSYVVWMKRIGSVRSEDLKARFVEARESLPIALDDSKYHFVLNDNLEDVLKDIDSIIKGEPVSEHRTSLARQTAELLIGRLGDD
ncbi:MAG: hypothetical protein M3Q79_00155 [bacterium]|nr:hypothetical protein [bacterium]